VIIEGVRKLHVFDQRWGLVIGATFLMSGLSSICLDVAPSYFGDALEIHLFGGPSGFPNA